MPYMLISAEIRMDTGPTYVGDFTSDPELMTYLEANKVNEPIQPNFFYRTKLLPLQVLNLLEVKGWRVQTSTGIGQTCLWTLYKDGVDIEDLLPPKPQPPYPSDCCGTGCCPCVHDIYEQDMKTWKIKCEEIRNGCREASDESSSAIVPYEWREFEIVKLEELNASTNCYTFNIQDSQVLGINIGQHIIVKQTVKGRVVTRQYTPVSEVNKRGSFEVVIKIYTNGKVTSLIKDWKVGDYIPWRGPFGEFSYQANGYKRILMLVAGTGIAPMFQIIRKIIENEDDMTFIKLFYASKSISDILLRQELVNFCQYWNFTACHYLSNEADLTKKKHCEEVVGSRMSKENVLNELRNGPIDSTLVLICGTNSFNKDMVNSAKDANIPDRNIFMF